VAAGGPTQVHGASSSGAVSCIAPREYCSVIVSPAGLPGATCQRTGACVGPLKPTASVDQAESGSAAPSVPRRAGSPVSARIRSASRASAASTRGFVRSGISRSNFTDSISPSGSVPPSPASTAAFRRAMNGCSRSGRQGISTAPESRRIMSSSNAHSIEGSSGWASTSVRPACTSIRTASARAAFQPVVPTSTAVQKDSSSSRCQEAASASPAGSGISTTRAPRRRASAATAAISASAPSTPSVRPEQSRASSVVAGEVISLLFSTAAKPARASHGTGGRRAVENRPTV